ncbi:class II fructose-1,6-bisphosphate aldolase [Aquimarina addita]|uniref:Class II fructose-1,6-bisphosphate aldolase n=1 Tax=Aquimarina addita TaxID=870485 RepID=A0ABP6UKD8_9FLAO
MRLQERLAKNKNEGKALLATNFYNFETLSAVLRAAKNTNSDIILQVSESSIDYLGVNVAKDLAKSASEQYGVTTWLHMDHGQDVTLVKKCIDAGFDSVMIDASEKPFEENVKITSEIVKYAESANVNVEAELGYISKLGQDQKMVYTQPKEAKQFVEATGVNALAIAVGSAHGFYKETPKLQIDLIQEINEVTPAALVLHGSSGIPDDQLQKAIKNGITKINLATEIKNIFMKSLREEFVATDGIDLRVIFPKATAKATSLVEDKLRAINHKNVQDKLKMINFIKVHNFS